MARKRKTLSKQDQRDYDFYKRMLYELSYMYGSNIAKQIAEKRIKEIEQNQEE